MHDIGIIQITKLHNLSLTGKRDQTKAKCTLERELTYKVVEIRNNKSHQLIVMNLKHILSQKKMNLKHKICQDKSGKGK